MLSAILMVVLWLFVYVTIFSSKLNKTLVDLHILEFMWTVLPMVILLFIAYPSLYLLYLTESTPTPSITIKAVAHQWYWEYQYDTPSYTKTFDSYIGRSSTSEHPPLRNLDVDNRIRIPVSLDTLLYVTSVDVLHCYTVPTLGVKVDAVPGRLNAIILAPDREGVFYGQCRELCGSNHSFIPITVETVSSFSFINFLSNND